MRLIPDWKTEIHRLWVIRASVGFAVFTALAGGVGFLAGTLNPWLLLVLAIIFNVVLIPLARLAKQEVVEPVAVPHE